MKLHNLRNLAMILIFLAFAIMYIGMFSKAILPFCFAFGSVILIISISIYFRLGAISIRIPQIECVSCQRTIKVLGQIDSCPHCKTRYKRDSFGEYQPIEPTNKNTRDQSHI
jgi:Zinc-ribbon containing domain